MGLQESQPDFLEKLKKEKEDFEKELLRQGYNFEAINSRRRLIKDYGPFRIAVRLADSPKLMDYTWSIDCKCYLGPQGENIELRKEFESDDYNIKRFKDAQAKLVKYISTEFLPHVKKALKLPKELSDLLEKK